MRANANIMIVDDEIALVPYREEHVAKYHEWMSSPELQELTASEPLSLEEEYEMQKKWQLDEDKLTFIVCARNTNHPGTESHDAPVRLSSLTMIGDVNLFLKGTPPGNGDGEDEFEVEAEIMIAEPGFRRQGYAERALQMMLSYATSPSSPAPLPVPKDRFIVRIGARNEPSIRLFQKLGFTITKHVEVFDEVEMRLLPEAAARQTWKAGDVWPLAL